MTSNQPLDLDHLAALDAAATPGPWHLTDSSAIVAPLTGDEIADVWEPTAASRNGEFIEAAREALPALVDEVRRLRARVAELEGPAVEACAALAALCYDLEDPGTAALGALYLISRATTGVEAPRDDAAEALARHDAEVIRKAAQTLEETDRDDDAVNLLYLLADRTESAARPAAAVEGRCTMTAPTVVIDGQPVPLDDCIWLQQRPCGCTVAAVVAVERSRTLATAEQAHEHFNPTPSDRARAATARLTVVPVTSAQYREQYRPRWRCDTHAARSAAV